MKEAPPSAASGKRSRSWSERLAWLNPCARIEPADPVKELRFTRAAQAAHFAAAAIVCACITFALAAMSLWPWHADGSPFLTPGWPPLLPVSVMGVFIWLQAHCASHAYIILSPVGIEIFPFWFPTENFRLVPWTHVAGARAENGNLIIDFPPLGSGGGIILSLSPLRPRQRELLWHAIERRLAERPAG